MSVGSVQAFQPANTVILAVSDVSATVELPRGGSSILITNPTAQVVFVHLGGNAAAITDTPVMAGGRLLLNCPSPVQSISAITATGSGTIYLTRGDGTAY
jgi:hypothetical protein